MFGSFRGSNFPRSPSSLECNSGPEYNYDMFMIMIFMYIFIVTTPFYISKIYVAPNVVYEIKHIITGTLTVQYMFTRNPSAIIIDD